MTFTPTVERGTPVWADCKGLNHKDSGPVGTCDKCGQPVVKIEGKTHLANVHTGNYGGRVYNCWNFHTCDPDDIDKHTAHLQQQRNEGVIVKGDTVEVFKGRKVPKGTIGIVRWQGIDGWDNEKVGLEVEGEDGLVFTAQANVRHTT